MRVYALVAATCIVLACAGHAMAQGAAVPAAAGPVAFEAASIKERAPAGPGSYVGRRPGGRFAAENASLRELIEFAYQIQAFQLIGTLAPVESSWWDITAKLEGLPTRVAPGRVDEIALALRALLADRFGLAVRPETRELEVYALMPARADAAPGPRLTKSAIDCPALIAAVLAGGAPPPENGPRCDLQGRIGSLQGSGLPLSELALGLSTRVQRAVVDRTGLTGTWDFTLTYAADTAQIPAGALPPGAPAPAAAPDDPSLFTALQEQLGLRLVPARAPVDVLVIDRVSRPLPD